MANGVGVSYYINQCNQAENIKETFWTRTNSLIEQAPENMQSMKICLIIVTLAVVTVTSAPQQGPLPNNEAGYGNPNQRILPGLGGLLGGGGGLLGGGGLGGGGGGLLGLFTNLLGLGGRQGGFGGYYPPPPFGGFGGGYGYPSYPYGGYGGGFGGQPPFFG